MCDCYTDKCRGCGKEIEIHLSDYNTGRDEIEVYCGKCLPKDLSEGKLWRYRNRGENWQMVFVKALTENAKDNEDGNHPNEFDVEDGIPEGALWVRNEKRLRLQTKSGKPCKRKSRKTSS